MRIYDEHVLYVLNAARINWRFPYLCLAQHLAGPHLAIDLEKGMLIIPVRWERFGARVTPESAFGI